jgi:hypothetical protein
MYGVEPGRDQALYCGLGVWTAGLAPKSGLCGPGLLFYVVKARARMSGLGSTRPLVLRDIKVLQCCDHGDQMRF